MDSPATPINRSTENFLLETMYRNLASTINDSNNNIILKTLDPIPCIDTIRDTSDAVPIAFQKACSLLIVTYVLLFL